MKLTCKHCGTAYRAKNDASGFCCSGCAHVYALIQEEGLGGFYAEQKAGAQPVGDRPFRDLDFTWAGALQQKLEAAETSRVVLRLTGMSCLGCLWLVERLCQRQEGVRAVKASLTGQMLRLEWERGAFDLQSCLEALHRFGYTASDSLGAGRWTAMDWRCLLTAVFAVNSAILSLPPWEVWGLTELSGLFRLMVLLCWILSALAGGAYLMSPLYRSVQHRQLAGDTIRGAVVFVGTLLALAGWLFPHGTSSLPGDWWYPVWMLAMLIPDWLGSRLGLERFLMRGYGWLGVSLGLLLLLGWWQSLLAWVPLAYLVIGLLFVGGCVCLQRKESTVC